MLHEQEMTEQEKLGQQADQTQSYNINEMMDDPELLNLHADRIAQLQTEHERRLQMQRKGHGQVTEINEGEFLEVVTKGEHVVVHFFHRDFERCKIMDKHLAVLAKKHFKTKFVRISAPVSIMQSNVSWTFCCETMVHNLYPQHHSRQPLSDYCMTSGHPFLHRQAEHQDASLHGVLCQGRLGPPHGRV